MELTVEQVLQQVIAAHKKGKLQDAERLYRAIMQSQPKHPDANHNLGVIAVSVNKVDVALPLFKTALETNPKIEQFWLSYIDALIKEKKFENAKQVIRHAKTKGVTQDKLNALEIQLAPEGYEKDPTLAMQKRLIISTEAQKLSEEKKQKRAKKNLKTNNPSQQQVNEIDKHYQNKRFEDAEKLATSIIQQFPQHPFGWKALGAIIGETGRRSDAADAHQKAVALSPKDAEAHYNLGNTLQVLGRLDEFVASYIQAIALKPDYAGAYVNFSLAIKNVRFKSSNPKLYPPLIKLLTIGNFTRPMDMARSILSLLKHDPLIKGLLAEKNTALNQQSYFNIEVFNKPRF